MRELLDDAGSALRARPDARARPRLLHAHLFEFTSDALGAQSGVGGGGRYDGLIEQLGGAADARPRGWAAGVERMLLAAGELPIAPELVDLFVALADDAAAGRAGVRARRTRPAGPGWAPSSSWPAARSRASSSTPTGSARATLRSSTTRSQVSLKDMESGEQTELEPAAVIPTILRGSRLA